jgi:N-dimethylarginine dimethylaminohydrolase
MSGQRKRERGDGMTVFAGTPEAIRAFVEGAGAAAPFRRVLMVDPEHFQVLHAINPHMEGQKGAVDPGRARQEWDGVRAAYERLGFPVSVMPGLQDHPDAVFAANQLLPFTAPNGDACAVQSAMAHAERRGEVPHLAAHAESLGLRTSAAPEGTTLEGTGDAVWHPGRHLIWGGYGFRTRLEAWTAVAERTGARVIPLRLVDPRLYHLDVALMPLDADTALSYRGAFDEESWARLAAGFPRLVEADASEVLAGFALNGHTPDGRHVLLPAGNPRTRSQVEALGFEVLELSTREFQKSGGSIFCLKNMLP